MLLTRESRAPRKRLKHAPVKEGHPEGLGLGSGDDDSATSNLDQTLGLHRRLHSRYIGASSIQEERLIDLLPYTTGTGTDSTQLRSKFRRVNATTSFIDRSDDQTLFCDDDEDDCDEIESIVAPHGPALVALYFRIVHPSYPILHKAVLMDNYRRSYRGFPPPLLAAIYALALDWWEFDRELSSFQKPDYDRLVKIALKTLNYVSYRPKLSTIQAGLLLLQRSGGDSWVLSCQVVAVAEELGLHRDCSDWDIPEWEKGLRGRLTWAVYMQDKWASLIHGRPSHVHAPREWQMRPLTLHDFPESSAADQDEQDGSTEVEKGRLLFMHLAALTEIMTEAVDILHGIDAGDDGNEGLGAKGGGVSSLLELIKPTAVRLKNWAATLPLNLRLEDVKTRKLCSNGYLHLSYFATEIIIHRHIIRTLSPSDSLSLTKLCRDAAKARLEHAATFVEALRPEHLQGFWWFASAKCLALIRVYGGLLWATSLSEGEASVYKSLTENYRWSLKVRAKGVSFVADAIREMEESLEELDMTCNPPLVRHLPGMGFNNHHSAAGSSAAVSPMYADHDSFGSGQFSGFEHDASGYDILNFDAVASDALYAEVAEPGGFFASMGHRMT
jgi:hypothetical protein